MSATSENEMMNIEELQKAKLNPRIVDEAFKESEKHLMEILECRKEFDSKAFTLLTGYLTAIAVFLSLKGSGILMHSATLFLGASVFSLLLGSISLFFSLLGLNYGFLGSDPESWLRKSVVDSSDDAELTRMKAYLTFDRQKHIENGGKNNRHKLLFLEAGIVFGIIALGIPLIVTVYIRVIHFLK